MMDINERGTKRNNSSNVVSSFSDTPFISKKKASGGRPKSNREIKERKNIAILPSLYEKTQNIAYVEGKSVSEVISEYLEKYIKKNADKLEEYDKIKK